MGNTVSADPANGGVWAYTEGSNECVASYPWVFNVCSPGVRAPLTIPGVCLSDPSPSTRQNQAAALCASLGAPGEWELAALKDTKCVSVDTGNGPLDASVRPERMMECCDALMRCDGLQGREGFSVECVRASFTGNPVACCLADMSCRARDSLIPLDYQPLCFTPLDAAGASAPPPVDPALGCPANGQIPCPAAHTCAPKQRDVAGAGCAAPLAAYCAGDDAAPNDTSWLGRWTQPDGTPTPNSCLYALQRRLFSLGGQDGICSTGPAPPPGGQCGAMFGGVGRVDTSSPGALWAAVTLERALAKYRSQGFVLGAAPGDPGFSVFQEFLYEHVCCPYPGVCQAALRSACRGFDGALLSRSPPAARLCGCHLPPRAYAQYTDRFQIGVPCTPLCSYAGAVPLTDGAGAPLPCEQSVCLIDDVSVSLTGSEVQGDVNISQYCSGCAAGAGAVCSCIVDDDALTAIGAKVGGSVQIGTQCTSATCSRLTPAGVEYAPCPTGPSQPASEGRARNPRLGRLALAGLAFVAALLAVVVLLAALRPPLRRAPSR